MKAKLRTKGKLRTYRSFSTNFVLQRLHYTPKEKWERVRAKKKCCVLGKRAVSAQCRLTKKSRLYRTFSLTVTSQSLLTTYRKANTYDVQHTVLTCSLSVLSFNPLTNFVPINCRSFTFSSLLLATLCTCFSPPSFLKFSHLLRLIEVRFP